MIREVMRKRKMRRETKKRRIGKGRDERKEKMNEMMMVVAKGGWNYYELMMEGR